MFDLKTPRVAVIGGGMAGLSCARALQEAGVKVTVFDKARGAGGRMSTRRAEAFHFDHGAQYFTVRDAAFDARVTSWIDAGVVTPWDGRLVGLPKKMFGRTPSVVDRFVGTPGMSAVLRHFGRDLEIRHSTRITGLSYEQDHWWLESEDEPIDDIFSAVVLAVPAPQAVPLLQAMPDWRAQVEAVEMAPTWAVMVAFDEPLDSSFDGAFVDHPALSWVSRNNSKPGRPDTECWVLHGTAQWSREQVDTSEETIAEHLLDAWAEVSGIHLPPIAHLRAHRWLYARTTTPLDQSCLVDPQRRIAVCGDWCPGSRVEGAYLSGLTVARQFLEHASLQAEARL